jgi:C-terminal processing protease CtpA/Prc
MAKFHSKTRAIIVDARFYPRIRNWHFLKYFTHLHYDSYPFFTATKQHRSYPGCFVSGWNTPIVDTVPLYKGKIYVLVNYNTLSLCEVFVMALQMNPNVKIIGSQTEGVVGSISEIPLPFGVTVMFSGLGMYYPDGAEIRNKGVKIDYEVCPEIKDLQEDIDTYIEKALELIMNENTM